MKLKNLLSVVLALCLMLSFAPVSAGAAEAADLEVKSWPASNTIITSGIYTVPADLSGTVTVNGNITVKIIGNAANTAANPYSGLSFSCNYSKTHLIIQDLNVNSTGSAVLAFSGTGNTLTLEGESTFNGMLYGSSSLVQVNGAFYGNQNQAAELAVDGTGILNVFQPSDTFAAAIGGDAGAPCGKLTIVGGTVNAVTQGSGAAIGAGSGGTGADITIDGGTVNAESRYAALTYGGYNQNSTGAAIGGGFGTSGGTYNITVNGGTVTAITSTNSAAIGSALYMNGSLGSDTANIIINGGKVTAYADDNTDVVFTGGAAIGSSYYGGAANITVEGGEVIAVTRTAAAAIGSGSRAKAATITVNGGTVTAFGNGQYDSPSYKGPAIGCGSFASLGNIYINAGAVMGVGNAEVNINGTISNSEGESLNEVVLDIPGVQSLTIGGIDWKVSANHADLSTQGAYDFSGEVHIWIPAYDGAQELTVVTEDAAKHYDLWSNGTANEYHTVTYTLTGGLSTDGPDKVYDPISSPSWNEDLEGTLAASEEEACAKLPEYITVTVGGEEVDFEYDPRTGEFLVAGDLLTGDVVITAEGVVKHSWVEADCSAPKHCSVCGATEGEALEHVPGEAVKENEVAADCTKGGSYDLVVRCTKCDAVISTEHKTTEPKDHTWTDATCTAAKTCSVCGATEGEPLAHTPGEAVKENEQTADCTKGGSYDLVVRCTKCDAVISTEHKTTEPKDHTWTDATCTAAKTCSVCGTTEGKALGHDYRKGKCSRCGAADPDYVAPADTSVTRIFGDNRFETATKVADQMKEVLGLEQFDAVILANGYNFADALAGSYLSTVKKAPILLTWNGAEKYNYLNDATIAYVKANLKPGGTVYILGGTSAVPASIDEALKDFKIQRMDGANRFETNIMILEEAGVPADSEILVCTSTNFADSLSASAAGKPILLVWNESGKLMDCQKEFLDKHCAEKNGKFRFVGGYSAVSFSMEKLFRGYGTTDRISGNNRFETSVALAEAYFGSGAEKAVLAYAWDFPDGLCGGPLAYAMNAPLVLTMTGYEAAAAEYVGAAGIESGVVLGGEKLISDGAVRAVFAMDADAVIAVK